MDEEKASAVGHERRRLNVRRGGPEMDVEQPSAELRVGEDGRAFMRAVAEGLADLEAGRGLTLRDVKARLGIG